MKICKDCSVDEGSRPIYIVSEKGEGEALCAKCIGKRDDEARRKATERTPLEGLSEYNLCVGSLKKMMEDVPDSTMVVVEKAEDQPLYTIWDAVSELDGEETEVYQVFQGFWHPKKDIFVLTPYY